MDVHTPSCRQKSKIVSCSEYLLAKHIDAVILGDSSSIPTSAENAICY